MKKYDFKTWLKASGIRAIKTVAQSMLGAIGTAQLFCDIDVKAVLSIAVLSGVCSLLTSVVGLPELEEK